MTIEPRPIDLENPFAASREKFEAFLVHLGGDEALASDHAALERQLMTEGYELLRQLFQDHLLLRSVREVAAPSVTGTDGVVRTWRRETDRPLETIFGTVTVFRLAYSAEGTQSLHPMDAELNLPGETFSLGVRRHVAEAVAGGAYDAAVASVLTNTAAHIAKRQAEQLALRAAADFDAFYQQRADTASLGSRDSRLVMTVDGKGVVMRPDGLREETRKAAARKIPKLKHRSASGEKTNRKRMACVAAVYAIGRFPRTAADIMDDLRREAKAEKRPRPKHKRVWASLEKEPEVVIREAFAEAECRDPNRKKTWVVLLDGNPTQIEIVQRVAKELGREVVIVLDFIHAVEYLWGAGHALFEAGSEELEAWVSERMTMLLEGKVTGVARGMRRSATCRGLDRKQREAIVSLSGIPCRDRSTFGRRGRCGMRIAPGG